MTEKTEKVWTGEVPTRCQITGEPIENCFVFAKVSYRDGEGELKQTMTTILPPVADDYANEPGEVYSLRSSDGKWVCCAMPDDAPEGTMWAPFEGKMRQMMQDDNGQWVMLIGKDD